MAVAPAGSRRGLVDWTELIERITASQDLLAQ